MVRSATSLLADLEQFQEEHKLNEEATLGDVKNALEQQIVDDQKAKLRAGRQKRKSKSAKDSS